MKKPKSLTIEIVNDFFDPMGQNTVNLSEKDDDRNNYNFFTKCIDKCSSTEEIWGFLIDPIEWSDDRLFTPLREEAESAFKKLGEYKNVPVLTARDLFIQAWHHTTKVFYVFFQEDKKSFRVYYKESVNAVANECNTRKIDVDFILVPDSTNQW